MLRSKIKVFVVFVTVVSMSLSFCLAQSRYTPKSYFETYSETAKKLMRETGVPASVILAIAFHESAYGNSRVASHLNNHFGIKGKNSNKQIRSAYKDYDSVTESYRDFVDLLQRRKSTQSLFEKYNSQDFNAWVKGISKSGYSVTKDWSRKVLATIDRYDLDEYDEKIILN